MPNKIWRVRAREVSLFFLVFAIKTTFSACVPEKKPAVFCTNEGGRDRVFQFVNTRMKEESPMGRKAVILGGSV